MGVSFAAIKLYVKNENVVEMKVLEVLYLEITKVNGFYPVVI